MTMVPDFAPPQGPPEPAEAEAVEPSAPAIDPFDGIPVDVVHPMRPQLLLLAGMLGDVSLWDGVAADLLGLVTLRTSRIDLASSIGELAELVLAEAPPSFALAGHSLGAVVALEVVRRAPERVTRLALLHASAREPSEGQRAHWRRLTELVQDGKFVDVAEELARANLPEGKRVDRALLDACRRMAANVGASGLLRQLEAQQTRTDALQWMPALTIPTVIVSGELDDVSPLALQQEIAAAAPGAVHQILPGTGHMSPLESPSELAAVLRSWLEV